MNWIYRKNKMGNLKISLKPEKPQQTNGRADVVANRSLGFEAR